MTESLVGNLMVASTLVTDPLFSRGVCLMVHHDESGAIGVMLNRPITPPPPALLKILGATVAGGEDADEGAADKGATGGLGGAGLHGPVKPASPAQPMSKSRLPAAAHGAGEATGQGERGSSSGVVHFGGPLSGPVVAVHGSLALAEVETGRGVYVAAQKDHLEALVRESTSDYRLIIGHAAWSTKQLIGEFDAGMWHLLPATPETVFPLHDDLWPYLIRRATGASVAAWVGADDRAGMTGLN